MLHNVYHHYFELMGNLFIIGIMSDIRQLNSSVVRLSSPGSIGVTLFCNKAIFMCSLVSMHFNGMLYEFDTGFYLSIALVVV